MKTVKLTLGTGAGAALLVLGFSAHAATIICDIDAPNAKNYMEISDSQVSSCIDAGQGTLSGNNSGGNPDEFLSSPAGADYETVSKSDGTNPFNIHIRPGSRHVVIRCQRLGHLRAEWHGSRIGFQVGYRQHAG